MSHLIGKVLLKTAAKEALGRWVATNITETRMEKGQVLSVDRGRIRARYIMLPDYYCQLQFKVTEENSARGMLLKLNIQTTFLITSRTFFRQYLIFEVTSIFKETYFFI